MNYNTVLSYRNSYNNNNNMKIEHFYHRIGEDWFTYPNLYKNMIEKYKTGGHFVEVGSWKGRSASFMAVEINNSGLRDKIKFDCVDTWEGSIEHKDMDEIKNNSLYEIFLNNIDPVKDLITPVRKSSLEASKLYEDSSLDFVFIDASHEYQDVLDDIEAWLPKLKQGGVLAGHDYGRSEVNKAVNDYFLNKNFTISEDCWIHEKTHNVQNTNSDQKITLVTGLWDIGRSGLGEGWSRSYSHYLNKFRELLECPVNIIFYGDEELEKFVFDLRKPDNTQFIKRDIVEFAKKSEFYDKIQKIRTDEKWLNSSSWLRESTQARLEMYNPLVMSKMFLLNDARILDKFNSDYLFWIDAGITNTVHPGYFTHDRVFEKITKYIDRFSFICFPYNADREIHGFLYPEINRYATADVKKVARGGFFGGPKESIQEINGLYYQMLNSTLSDGFMGTEESIFSILTYLYPDIVQYFEIEENGLIGKFFEDLKNSKLVPKSENKFKLNFSNTKVGLYILTFNSPNQVKELIESFLAADKDFLNKPDKFLINNSTDLSTFDEYESICKQYNFEHIKKDNLGVCGGRQFAAEHSDEKGYDFHIFFEDDMMLHKENTSLCRNHFPTYVKNLYSSVLQIAIQESFDFLKFSFSEFYGDNGTQWAWYNVPQNVRDQVWPDYNKLPTSGTDPNAPKTNFKHIKFNKNVTYVTGEIYYSNWPQIVSKEGNRKMFLTTKWAYPYEQTWMSYIFQETIKGNIKPGLLLSSPVNHNRFEHYDGKLRKES